MATLKVCKDSLAEPIFTVILLLLLALPVQAQQWFDRDHPRIAGHTVPRTTTTTTVKFGINGHDGRTSYPLTGIEARMQWMQQNHLTVYRTDVGTSSTDILDQLVPLAKKYGVTVRPMLYPGTQAATYNLVKRYANDIKIWEVGNEQDAPKAGAQDRINAMMQSVKGVDQAEAELHAGLKTSINMMACNDSAGSGSQCEGDANGDVWFLDMAKASGWNFSYVTFHYYPRIHDPGHWMDKYLGQMRKAATKFGVPIFFNETNCGEIYDGNTDGGGNCNTALQQALDEVVGKYSDVVAEVYVYELLDQPDMAGVERYFGVCYAMGNCKPTAMTLSQFGAMTTGGTTPPVTPPVSPPITGTVTGTFVGTFTGTFTASTQPPVIPPVTGTPGPRQPVGPQASVTCTGTAIAAGADIQAAINAKPAGTTYCLAAGTWNNVRFVPKAGDKYIGKVGTILDGKNTTARAIDGGNIANVTIQNLVIKNYTAGIQDSPLRATGSGWKVLNNEIANNAGVGMHIATEGLVQYNNIHHNGEMGIGNGGGDNIKILDNEIAFNNYQDKYDCNFECGGLKLWATTDANVSYNWAHDNHGPALWADYNNYKTVYSWNKIENNNMMGIHHEISYDASIHDNVITNNGKNIPACNWLWCAGISIAASGGVNGGKIEIFNNTITPGSQWGNAIGLIQQNREGPNEPSPHKFPPPWAVTNVDAHDNTIDLSKGGGSGATQDINSAAIYTTGNNKFDKNHYTLGTNNQWSLWWSGPTPGSNASGGKTYWQGLGNDLNGTFQ
jgi:Right handed beta helix region